MARECMTVVGLIVQLVGCQHCCILYNKCCMHYAIIAHMLHMHIMQNHLNDFQFVVLVLISVLVYLL